jgi:hypothetical protein
LDGITIDLQYCFAIAPTLRVRNAFDDPDITELMSNMLATWKPGIAPAAEPNMPVSVGWINSE